MANKDNVKEKLKVYDVELYFAVLILSVFCAGWLWLPLEGNTHPTHLLFSVEWYPAAWTLNIRLSSISVPLFMFFVPV